jgi:Fur family ferric uptake transcriptional regulator
MLEIVIVKGYNNRMTCSPTHTGSLIRERGFRLTSQRVVILDTLHDAGRHLSPVEIYKRAKAAHPGITEPTVYRTLNFLVENSLVSVTHVGSGRLEYELAQHKHHHLVCRACGKHEELAYELLQSFYDQLEQITGYRLLESQITFTGLCSHCK